MKQNHLPSARNVTVVAMFGAPATVLVILEVPLSFTAPPFYGIDISEVLVLVGTFVLGFVAGVVMELVKVLVKLIPRPTSTGLVGEFVNFCVECSLALPVDFIYRLNKTKRGAIIGMAAGTVVTAVVVAIFNAVVMLPLYPHSMPLGIIIAAGAAINPVISNVWTFVILVVGPPDILEGVIISLLITLIYKRISVTIHSDSERRAVKTS